MFTYGVNSNLIEKHNKVEKVYNNIKILLTFYGKTLLDL